MPFSIVINFLCCRCLCLLHLFTTLWNIEYEFFMRYARCTSTNDTKYNSHIASHSPAAMLFALIRYIYTFSGQYSASIWRCLMLRPFTGCSTFVISHRAFLSRRVYRSVCWADVGIWPTQTQCLLHSQMQCRQTSARSHQCFVDFLCMIQHAHVCASYIYMCKRRTRRR